MKPLGLLILVLMVGLVAACTSVLTPVRDCSVLTATDIAEATGRSTTASIRGDPSPFGEMVCNYEIDGGQLSLSVFYESLDAIDFYDEAIEGMIDTESVPSLGPHATYGRVAVAGTEELAVFVDGVSFTLVNRSSMDIGREGLEALARTILDRLIS